MELGYYIMQKALAPEWTRKSVPIKVNMVGE